MRAEAILKAVAWVEKVAEFQEEQRATHGRFVWAAKDKIVEILSEGGRLSSGPPATRCMYGVAGGAGGKPGPSYWLAHLGLG